jgi:hypothetical protein
MALIGSNIFIGNSIEKTFIGTDRYDATTTPTFVGIMTASDGLADDRFGNSVAVGNGIIVIGAPFKDGNGQSVGGAYIFDLDGNQVGIITSPVGIGDLFGDEVAVGSDKIVFGISNDYVSASGQGSAYIYDLDGTNGVQIFASDGAGGDNFGSSVAVGCEKVVVGAYRDNVGSNNYQGSVYIFDLDGNNETKITAIDGSTYDQFGASVAVGSGRIVVGAYPTFGGSSGSAHIYDLDGNQLGIITASDGAVNDTFGYSVAVGSGKIVVGAYSVDIGSNANQGAAYIYDLDGNQLGIITASDGAADDHFGYSVAIGSGRIVIGAYNVDIGSNANQGAAYIYDLDGNQLGIITASDGAADDFFGASVAVGSGRIVVGADRHDIGSNDDQGSAYLFSTPESDHILDILDK